MTTPKEIQFIDKIDCNFPYHDGRECLRLIEEAASISTNALFTVVEEICRIPVSERENVETAFLLDMLSQVKTKINHPIKEIVLDTADKMVRDQQLTVDEAISRMEYIKNYAGQYAAMSILYFSCDDVDGKLELIWKNVMSEWKNNATQQEL